MNINHIHVLVQCDVETHQINIPNLIEKAHTFLFQAYKQQMYWSTSLPFVL
jgi:hypothetical protein